MPVSSSTRIAASWIASTPSGGSGSVGRSGFSGMRQGIWRIACAACPRGMAGVPAAAAPPALRHRPAPPAPQPCISRRRSKRSDGGDGVDNEGGCRCGAAASAARSPRGAPCAWPRSSSPGRTSRPPRPGRRPPPARRRAGTSPRTSGWSRHRAAPRDRPRYPMVAGRLRQDLHQPVVGPVPRRRHVPALADHHPLHQIVRHPVGAPHSGRSAAELRRLVGIKPPRSRRLRLPAAAAPRQRRQTNHCKGDEQCPMHRRVPASAHRRPRGPG